MICDNKSPLLSIHCLVYNHAPHLRKCLDGFVMQQTSFKFEAIVHDDASTDGSADIIREYAEKYPDIIKPIIEEENQYSKRDGSIERIMDEASTGKYMAFCEGDDHWTDPFKLQKQVDFLESHTDYAFSHTAYATHDVINDKYGFNEGVEVANNKFKDIYQPADMVFQPGPLVLTLTVVARRELIQKAKQEDRFLFSGYFMMGDTTLWFMLARYGKVHYLAERTATYSILQESASHSNNIMKRWRFFLSCQEMKMYICKRYNITGHYKRETEDNYNFALLEYLMLDKTFKPLYPLDLSRFDIATRMFFPLGLLPKWRALKGIYKKLFRNV